MFRRFSPAGSLAIIAGLGGVVALALAVTSAQADSSALGLQVTSTPEPTPVPPEFLPSPESSGGSTSHSCIGIDCEFRVESSTDDAGLVVPFPPVGSCFYSTLANEVYLGECPDGEPIVSGFRFPNVTIPKDALIEEAYLEFTVDGPYDNNILSEIYGELSPNPQPFGPPPSRPADRSRTFSFLTWSVPSTDPWQLSQTRRTPDLTPVLQEIIDQGNWQPGNAVAFIVEGVPLGAQSDPDPARRHRRVIGIERPPATYSGDVARLIVRLAAPRIDSIEFTQAIQELQSLDELKADLAADGEPPVPIVTRKQAVVRVYMEEVATVTRVKISVQIPGVLSLERTITLQPGCTADESRTQENNCLSADFYFGPPEGSWTATVTTFDMQDNEIESHDLSLTSVETKRLTIFPVRVCDATDPLKDVWFCGTRLQFSRLLPFLRSTFPGRVGLVVTRTEVKRETTLADKAWMTDIVNDILDLWVTAGSPKDDYYYGIVRAAAGGLAKSSPGGVAHPPDTGNAAVSRVSVKRFDLDGDRVETADEIVAHELGHNFGRLHAPSPAAVGCYNNPKNQDPEWPADESPLIQEVGFDLRAGRALLPEAHADWMSYCTPRWIRPYTYTAVVDVFRSTTTTIVPGQFWLVSGLIEGGTAIIDPLYEFETKGSLDEETGDHRIEVRDAPGSVLFTRRFNPTGFTSTEAQDETFEGPPAFSELIPVQESAASIVILDPGGIQLGNIIISGIAPLVDVSFPLGGEVLSGAQTLSWQVTDPDSTEHTFWVQYSADGGATWETLSPNIDDSELAVDFDGLPKSGVNSLIRIIASDGVNTGTAVSNPFTVLGKPPEAEIFFPGEGELFQLQQLIWLQGHGFDPDDGFLEGTALAWESDLDGVLGTGDELPITTLSEGTHVVMFTATDSDGNSASDSISVQVDGTDPALDLSILPDGIQANCMRATIDAADEAGGSGLAAVEFSLDAGKTFSTVSLDNLPFSFLVPGRGFVHVVARAIDKAGNLTATDQTFFFDAGCFVPIDIKPGSEPNAISSKGKGKVTVAILSTSDFQAPEEVDRDSLTFGRTGDEESLHRRGRDNVPNCGSEDANGDGLLDLVCRFNLQDTGFVAGDAEGILKGLLAIGAPIEGRDAVLIVP